MLQAYIYIILQFTFGYLLPMCLYNCSTDVKVIMFQKKIKKTEIIQLSS
jgi:hypothetical protein